MKKNLIKTALIVVFFFAAGYTVYNAQNKTEKLSGLVLANVEALARYELPEVGITCSGGSMGACYITSGECWLDSMGYIRYPDCSFSGYMDFSCTTLC